MPSDKVAARLQQHERLQVSHALLCRRIDQASAILAQCENSTGKGHDLRRMIRLRESIEKDQARLRQVEIALEHFKEFCP